MIAHTAKKIVLFLFALMLVAPAVSFSSPPEAHAASKGKKSRKGAKRKSRRKASSRRGSSRRTATTRRTVTRRAPARRTVSRRRGASRRRVDDRRVVHRRSSRVVSRRRAVRRRPIYRTNSRTTVVHHHHSDAGARRRAGRAPNARTVRGKRRGTDFFIAGNLGVSSLQANELATDTLPGTDFNLKVGGKGEILGLDVGFNVAGYRFDGEENSSSADLVKTGLFVDLKLQPTLSIFEPYVSVGGGLYSLNDPSMDITSTGGGLRFGAGMNLRIHDSIGLEAGYLFENVGYTDTVDSGTGRNSFGTQSSTLSAGLKIYF